MIEISEGQTNGNTVVYAVVMGELINLREFVNKGQETQHTRIQVNAFKAGAEALATALELSASQMNPEKVAQMAQEAARAAGVDESTIRQGGVAVGPWGAVSVPGDFIEGEEYDDCHHVYE